MEDLVFTDNKYSRTRLHLKRIEKLMKTNYKCKSAHMTSSGLAAISTLFNALYLKHKDDKINIIYSSELYYETYDIFLAFKQYYFKNAQIIKYDVNKPQSLRDIFENDVKEGINILFFESCSNPNSVMFDFNILYELKSLSRILYVIVDNTWLTETILNPFIFKCVDFVVVSMTKYYSGCTAIGGCIMCNSESDVSEYI